MPSGRQALEEHQGGGGARFGKDTPRRMAPEYLRYLHVHQVGRVEAGPGASVSDGLGDRLTTLVSQQQLHHGRRVEDHAQRPSRSSRRISAAGGAP